MTNDNPFDTSGGGYANQSVQFGENPAPASAGQADAVFDTTTASFQTDVLAASRDVTILVDFWAPWCGPCKQLTPVLEKAVRASGGTVRLAKMNIDEHPAIPGQLGVQSIPAVVAFKNGQPVDAFMGAVPESQVKAFIEKVAGPAKDPKDEVLEAAKAASDAGDHQGAVQIYTMALQQGLQEPEILAGLVETFFAMGNDEAAHQLLAQVPDEARSHESFARIDARLKLAEEVAAIGDPAALVARLESNPNDLDAKFDLSAIRNAEGKREEAADLLLQIVKADRTFRDDGARKKLLEYFEAWGHGDAVTMKARRQLSALFFS